jgi:ABC-type glycerol-3-phosphate transport system permease component
MEKLKKSYCKMPRNMAWKLAAYTVGVVVLEITLAVTKENAINRIKSIMKKLLLLLLFLTIFLNLSSYYISTYTVWLTIVTVCLYG